MQRCPVVPCSTPMPCGAAGAQTPSTRPARLSREAAQSAAAHQLAVLPRRASPCPQGPHVEPDGRADLGPAVYPHALHHRAHRRPQRRRTG